MRVEDTSQQNSKNPEPMDKNYFEFDCQKMETPKDKFLLKIKQSEYQGDRGNKRERKFKAKLTAKVTG